MANRLPCPTCPWRKSTPQRGFPGGIIDAQGLLAMVNKQFGSGVMQCHCTPDGEKAQLCVGFGLQVGYECFALRLMAIGRGVDLLGDLATDEPLHDVRSLLQTHGGIPE